MLTNFEKYFLICPCQFIECMLNRWKDRSGGRKSNRSERWSSRYGILCLLQRYGRKCNGYLGKYEKI